MSSSVEFIGPSTAISVEILGGRGPAGPAGSGAGFTAGGDLGGDASAQDVLNVHGITYPAGPIQVGQLPIGASSSTIVYDFLDLALTTGTLDGARMALATISAPGAISGAYKAAVDALIAGGGVSDATTSSKGVVQLAGDLAGTAALPVVAKVNGITHPAASLTVGQVARATGTGAVAYGALDLASSVAVTGLLAAGNQAPQALGGDVAGTTAAATITLAGDASGRVGSVTVGKVNGVTFPAGPLTAGQVARASGTGSVSYGAVDLANAAAVTGTLSAANQAAQALAGDAVGTTAANTVTLAGDVTGRAGVTAVAKVNGIVYPAATLTVGQVARATAAGTVAYGAIDLANGAAVTGLLAAANQGAQTMGGDVAGTTAASTVTLAGDVTGRVGVSVVAKVNGASYPAAGAFVTGTVPRATGPSTVAMGALDLANASAVTGALPASNQAAQSLSGDATGTTAAVVVAKVNGVTYGAGGALVTGTVSRVTGPGATAYGALDLANVNAVTGTLPGANVQLASGSNAGAVSSAYKAQLDAFLATGGGLYLAQNILCSAGTAVANVDVLIYTVPSTPTGAGRVMLTGILGRLKTALVGSGTVTISAGTSAGASDIQTARAFTSSNALGDDFGALLTDLGTAMTARGGNAPLAAGTPIYVRLATTGTVTTAPQFEVTAFGAPLGT